MRKVHLVYFSPGGTTKKTLINISEGIKQIEKVEIIHHDMTKYDNRIRKLFFSSDDLVILGTMTGTKMYGPIDEILSCLEGDNTPLISIVMYGNGFYGSALRDMKKYIEPLGFRVGAAGAFIGQYSFTDKIAGGRPDDKDKKIQLKFGKDAYTKIFINNDRRLHSKINLSWPKEGPRSMVKAAIIMAKPGAGMVMPKFWNGREIDHSCVGCKKCEKHCPMQAIDVDSKVIDINKCIGCNGCTNVCPTGAIHSTSITIKKMIDKKISKDIGRSEPDLFF